MSQSGNVDHALAKSNSEKYFERGVISLVAVFVVVVFFLRVLLVVVLVGILVVVVGAIVALPLSLCSISAQVPRKGAGEVSRAAPDHAGADHGPVAVPVHVAHDQPHRGAHNRTHAVR